jgi:hypothetical protein
MVNDSTAQKPYTSVTKAVLTLVEAQKDMPWLSFRFALFFFLF